MGSPGITRGGSTEHLRFARVAVFGFVGALALAFAPVGHAGTYTAVGCTVGGAAPAPETAVFDTTNPSGWASHNACGGDGLFIEAGSLPTPPSSSARWTISAPAGTRFTGGHFMAYAEASATQHRPRYLYRTAGTADLSEVGPIVDSQDLPTWHSWLEPNFNEVAVDQLVIEQRCLAGGGCNDGWGGLVFARDFTFQIEDIAQPSVSGLTGPLTEEPAQRGVQLLNIAAADQGSGVRRVELRANGELIAVKDLGCAVDSGGTALRLSPCPLTGAADFAVDTTKAPFREGKNSLEVCAGDFAQASEDPRSFAEESCTPTRAYVDNSCDVSQGADAADIRFGFGRVGKGGHTVRYGKRTRVVGKLTDAADSPVEGATVCVTTRDRLKHAAPRDIAEAQTNRRGKVKVKLPKGASRRVKLTYWADEEEVEMRTVRLNVRARPKLSVLSKRQLSDGGRVRFRVKLAGPYRGNRKIAVQALAPAGWLDFPGCTGRTNRKGYFRCAYRFREQSGDVKYKFRALAPRQRGYPYLQGRTKSKRVLVRD